MRSLKKALIGATVTLASVAGIVGATAGPAAAEPWTPAQGTWKLCKEAFFLNCWEVTGYAIPRVANLKKEGGDGMNDSISSIQTNSAALETWNDANFKGTYGYFAPWGKWDSLSKPYGDSISSISHPGA